MSADRQPPSALARGLAVGSVLNAAFGAYVALSVRDSMPSLVAFAALAVIGAVMAVIGAGTRRVTLAACGAILQAAAPTGFAWLASLVLTIAGVGVLVSELRDRRTRLRSSHD